MSTFDQQNQSPNQQVNVAGNINHYHGTTPSPTEPELLKKALAQLANLPESDIPAVTPLPAGSHLPYRANPFFVGREAELRTLARQLKGGEMVAMAAAMGLVGLAKASNLGALYKAMGRTQRQSHTSSRRCQSLKRC